MTTKRARPSNAEIVIETKYQGGVGFNVSRSGVRVQIMIGAICTREIIRLPQNAILFFIARPTPTVK